MSIGDSVVIAVYGLDSQAWVDGGIKTAVFDFCKSWVLSDSCLFFWGNGVENTAGYLVAKSRHRIRSRRFKNCPFVPVAIAIFDELGDFCFATRVNMTAGYGVVNANNCFHG